MSRISKFILTLFVATILGNFTYAQTNPTPLSANERKEVLDTTIKLISEQYIDENMASKIVAKLSEKSEQRAYDNISDPIAFAEKITDDIISISSDRHFRLFFNPDWVADSRKAITEKEKNDLLKRDLANWRKNNFGFKEVKILDGNIGYLNLESFSHPKYAGETAAGAMAFLSNTNAIIIDLRNNGGGFSTMVQLLASYFFDDEPIKILDMVSRNNAELAQDWTLPYVSGTRLPDVDLYILTSKSSFSAAESFTYFMKNRKRATIIGETTGGGAHPIRQIAVSDRFGILLPTGKPIDPITNTNWEIAGVEPDIPTTAKDALLTAQMEVVKKLYAKNSINENAYQWYMAELNAKQNPITLTKSELQLYAGTYGVRKLTYDDGKLFFQREGYERFELIPIAKDLFIMDGMRSTRIKINVEKGKATSITRLYDNGTAIKDLKTK